MDAAAPTWTLGELAEWLGGEVRGDASLLIARPVPADEDDPMGIAFAENEAYLEAALNSQVGALLVKPDVETGSKPAILVPSPRAAFGKLLARWARALPINSGIHPHAWVDPQAEIDPTASIGPGVTIERGARVGASVRVYAGSYVGENCTIDEGSVIYPNVVLMQDVSIGKRCILHSGCVIGADGFGFVWDGQRRHKVPQVGGVRIEDDVELGAGTCVDRATCGETRIGVGTKIDNMVQVGHNTRIGEHTVIAGHSSIAGSVRIGSRVTAGGQLAFKDHVRVGDDVVLAGRTGIMQDIEAPGQYFGTPATPLREAMRQLAAIKQLPDLIKRIKQLEAEVERLKREQS